MSSVSLHPGIIRTNLTQNVCSITIFIVHTLYFVLLSAVVVRVIDIVPVLQTAGIIQEH